ncbi:S66 family peptidase [Paenibacillus donghaensis]|uniref:LD-carboxypeptidase n=1 Tax=Paenibacillus donghaensis TaxID=414771 RepID=A0A2Z2KS23_9BACL|nr:S66 peptidase family protein [Paenibacillus donghaensis]ASA21878.1 LD-carboxypeptidase [Paenibacillus donghaensis]
MRADKLQMGDEIRVIAPSRSLGILSEELCQIAKQRLEALGFQVSFSKHALDRDEFDSSSVEARAQDLHQAFADPSVKAILTTIGGYNSNQLLKYIDYSLVAANPKRLCGYSDITALSNAIYARTELITYSGPHFSTFGMLRGNEYTLEYFNKLMIGNEKVKVEPSPYWSDDMWFVDQENRNFIPNPGPYAIHDGEAEGRIIGGNLGTLNLLQGTEFMPSLKESILFLEDDYESSPATFDRDLQSLLHLPDFEQVRGIVIGRFQRQSQMTKELLHAIIASKKELNDIPVIADVDFGHTSPQITYPVGGTAFVSAYNGAVDLTLSDDIYTNQ